MTKYETLAAGLAGALAALIYIARQVRRLAGAMAFWADLPAEHAQLVKATQVNTEAIAKLTTEVAWLRAAMAGRRR